MRFKMAPFRCAECGTEQLVDKAKVEYEGDCMIVTEPSLHLTSKPVRYEPRGFEHMGRYDLIREILRNRKYRWKP